MAGSLKSSFVNMGQNARAGAAQKFVSGLATGLRSGLKGSTSNRIDNPSSTGFKKEPLTLLYPSDIGINPHEASYILFTGYSISNAKVKPMKKGPKVATVWKTVGPGKKVVDTVATERAQAAADIKASNADKYTGTSFVLSTRNVKESGTVIGLYMPPAVNVSYSMDYESAPIGVMGEAIAGIIRDIQGGASFGDAIGSAAGTAGTGLKQMGIKTIDAVIPGAKDLIAIETGTIITPRTELMFRGIGRREFSFTFTFIPKDYQESKTVHQIVQKFKEGMTPTFKQASTTREMTIPDVFQIDYMHISGQNSYLNKIGKCYLEKMDVVYGGDKFVTYDPEDDGKGPPPQKTTITLSFKELEVMDRSKVSAGF